MFYKKEDGMALIMVLLMLIVGSVLVSALFISVRAHIRTAVHEEAMSKAFYAADSGAEFVKANIEEISFNDISEDEEKYLKIDNNGDINLSNTKVWIDNQDLSVPGSEILFNIKISKNNNKGTFISEGKYQNSKKDYTEEIELVYNLPSGSKFAAVTDDGEVYLLGENTDFK